MNIKEHLIELETSLLTFDVRQSPEKLRHLIAPEFREIGASGAYFGFESILERLPTEKNWHATVQDFECYELTPGLYQLVFRAYITNGDQNNGTYSLRSSLWRQHADGWQMVFHQGTKVAPFERTLPGSDSIDLR